MISVITGDIIHSRYHKDPSVWLDPLKKLFHKSGRSPGTWEIYRGDSFQLEAHPQVALKTAILIKANLKQVKKLDARIAIGFGDKSYDSPRISESTGEAFVRSGQLLEQLKQHHVNMALKSHDEQFDEEINMMIKLSLVIMNSWSTNSAEIAEIILENPELPQKKIGKMLGIAQSSVSERIHRGSIYEILEFESYYRKRIQRLTPK